MSADTNRSPHGESDSDDRLFRRVRDATEPPSMPAHLATALAWKLQDAAQQTEKPGHNLGQPARVESGMTRRTVLLAVVVALTLLALGLYLAVRPIQPNDPHPSVTTPSEAGALPDRPPNSPPKAENASEANDYQFEVTTDYDDKLRPMGPATPTLYSKATLHIRKLFPAKDFRFAWLVQCGPRQVKVLQPLTRDGGHFVAYCDTQTRTESGLVLFVLVLSREDSVHLSGRQTAVDIDHTVLDRLSRLYRDPVANAVEIDRHVADFRRAWGLPADSVLVVEHFYQVTQRIPLGARE